MTKNISSNRSSSNYNGIKILITLFVSEPNLRIIYIEDRIEEDINMKNQFSSEDLKDPKGIREAASKNCVGNFFNVP